MALALLIFATAFAALCVWLTVRIVNRKERWAKWTLATMLLASYTLSIGPAAWLNWFVFGPGLFNDAYGVVYSPLLLACRYGPIWFRRAMELYCDIWAVN